MTRRDVLAPVQPVSVFVNLREANSSTAMEYYRNIIACRNRGEVEILTRGHQSRSAGPFSWYDGI